MRWCELIWMQNFTWNNHSGLRKRVNTVEAIPWSFERILFWNDYLFKTYVFDLWQATENYGKYVWGKWLWSTEKYVWKAEIRENHDDVSSDSGLICVIIIHFTHCPCNSRNFSLLWKLIQYFDTKQRLQSHANVYLISYGQYVNLMGFFSYYFPIKL